MTYTVPASTTASPQVNTATVSATTTDPVGAEQQRDRHATRSLTSRRPRDHQAVGGAGPYVAGTNLTYTITVSNLGPSDSAGFTVTDTVPAGTTFVSASAGCANSAGTVTCT